LKHKKTSIALQQLEKDKLWSLTRVTVPIAGSLIAFGSADQVPVLAAL
jgi:hypothetical protein